jgi:rubrerythrin
MSSTMENLKEAFAGESQASQKYLSFAKKAEQEGFANIAKLFLAAAEAERIHADGHLKAMEGVNSTVENLRCAVAGETYEYKEMYPPMLEQAVKENHKAKRMFGYAPMAEEVHAELYQLALQSALLGKDLDVTEIYLCPVCGHIEFKKPDSSCPICGAVAGKYVAYK